MVDPVRKILGESTEVLDKRKCDFCDKAAVYDGRTKMGPWANMCESHFRQYGVGLGTGYGQKLVYKKR